MRTTRYRRLLRYAAVTAALTAAAATTAACSFPGAHGDTGSSADGVTTVRYQGSADQVTLPELADALGFFHGKIKLDFVGDTISGPQDIQSVATDQADIGEAFTGAVVKLVDAGAPITGVVTSYGSDARSFEALFVKNDSPIESVHDLIGKKIAVNTLGANYEAFIDTYLERGGLTPSQVKQVQLVVLPPNNTEEAIRKGEVDAGVLTGVLQDHAIAAGDLRVLETDTKLVGSYNGGQYVLRDGWIKSNPAAAKTLVTGIAKAIRWEQKTPRATVIAKMNEIIESRHRNENTDLTKFWKSAGIATPGGYIRPQDFTLWESWLKYTGVLHGALTPSKYFTNSLNGLYSGASS